jgi:hypothetical protein
MRRIAAIPWRFRRWNMTRVERIEAAARELVSVDLGLIKVREVAVEKLKAALRSDAVPHHFQPRRMSEHAHKCIECDQEADASIHQLAPIYGPAGADWREPRVSELASLQADAERYRFIRGEQSELAHITKAVPNIVTGTIGITMLSGDALDAAIDAARASGLLREGHKGEHTCEEDGRQLKVALTGLAAVRERQRQLDASAVAEAATRGDGCPIVDPRDPVSYCIALEAFHNSPSPLGGVWLDHTPEGMPLMDFLPRDFSPAASAPASPAEVRCKTCDGKRTVARQSVGIIDVPCPDCAPSPDMRS